MTNLYDEYKRIFEKKEFQTKIEKLKKKLKDKRVILYSNGVYFEAFSHVWDLKSCFNIVGISDIRYENEIIDEFRGFRCIKPSEIKKYNVDCILITSPNFESIKKYLISNKLVKKKILILDVIYKPSLKEKIVLTNQYLHETRDVFRTIKYGIFCSNEEIETKINYNKVLKKIRNKEKIRVLFVCEENSKWGYQSLWEKLVQNPKFEVLPIVLFPIKTSTRVEFTQDENKSFFNELGIETIDGYDYEKEENKSLKEFEPDIVFYQQPWYLEGINHPTNVSEYALAMMIPYGYTTLSEKEWGSDSVKRVYSNLFMFFSESKYHNRFYEKTARMRCKDNLLATGTPKLDGYFDTFKDVFWKGENIQKKIIYAPHHSLGDEGLRMSTFMENCWEFLNFAKNNPQCSFIFKPHPALKNMCAKTAFMNEFEYDEYVAQWNNLPNAYLYNKGNYIELFKTSDLLITDCSSFLAEYFPTGKPIFFLNRKDRAEFDKFGNILKQGFYEIKDFEDYRQNFEKIIIKKGDFLSSIRQRLIKRFFNNEKQSSELIYEFINSL